MIDSPVDASLSAMAILREGCAVLDLRDRDLLRLSGKDTPSFLNRLLTVDTLGLAEGQRTPAFLLEAKGKVKLSFGLTRTAKDTYLATAPKGHGADIVSQLDFYHFGEAYEATHVDQTTFALIGPRAVEVLGALDLPVPDAQRRLVAGESAVTRVDEYGAESYEIEGPIALADLVAAGAVEVGAAAVDALRISNGVGAWPNELNDRGTPLEVSGLRGVSEGKGCYPGQEVIERTLAIGRPARKLVQLRLDGPAGPGPLSLGGAPAGELTSVAQVGDEWFGLGLLKRKRAEVGAELMRDATAAHITRVQEDYEGTR